MHQFPSANRSACEAQKLFYLADFSMNETFAMLNGHNLSLRYTLYVKVSMRFVNVDLTSFVNFPS